MKKTRNVAILLPSVIMMILLICGTALAKRPTPPPECGGLTGTWHGEESGDMIWLAIHTSDSLDATKGEMLMNWIWIKPQLIGIDVSLTPGHGVWQQNSDGAYDYTWYAYAIDKNTGNQAYTVRVSGVALFDNPYDPDSPIDCNTVYIYYEFAVSDPVSVQEWSTADFVVTTTGGAVETRVPMVVTPLPAE